MRKIEYLNYLHDWWNDELFDGELLHITLLAKRNQSKDGYYEYKAHKDWRPIRRDLHRASITISDGCWDEDSVEETLVHEMIHQWQCEVLDEAPHHNDTFKKKARVVLDDYGLDVL